MTLFIIIFLIAVYITSIVSCWFHIRNHYRYCDRIKPSFIDVIAMFCPFVNTLICINEFKSDLLIKFFGLKK